MFAASHGCVHSVADATADDRLSNEHTGELPTDGSDTRIRFANPSHPPVPSHRTIEIVLPETLEDGEIQEIYSW